VASRPARRPRPRRADPRRRPHWRALPDRGARDRGGWPETRARAVGRRDRERRRVSEPADESFLVILDGAQALHKATRAVFGEAALMQRCQVHRLRNILDHRSASARGSRRWCSARIMRPT
jgi:hypothetical protein